MTDPYNQKAPPMKEPDDLPAIQMPTGDEVQRIKAAINARALQVERDYAARVAAKHAQIIAARLRAEFFHGKPTDTAGEHALITLGDLDTLLAFVEGDK